MIGLDTNVLVRYLVQDDQTQARHASRLIESCTRDEPGFISIVTLAEVTWVLKSAYNAGRDEILKVVENLLQTEALVVQMADVAWKALAVYRAGAADFADCLIERIGAAHDCVATYTFDQIAARDAGMQLLGSKN